MRNKKVIYILSIFIVIGLLFLIKEYHTRSNQISINKFNYLFDISDTTNLSIHRITSKKVELHSGNEFLDELGIQSGAIKGRIFYDIVSKTFWLNTSEYKLPDKDRLGYTHEELVNFDMAGKVISSTKRENKSLHPGLLLKNEVPLTYSWNDKTSIFYVDKYIKTKFHWGSLNPFQGFGDSYAKVDNRISQGIAILNLTIAQTVLTFKTDTENTGSGYTFRMGLYKLPRKYSEDKELFLVYIDDTYLNKKDKGLYLIQSSD